MAAVQEMHQLVDDDVVDEPVVSKNTNELKTGSPGRFVINVSTLGWPMGASPL